MNAPGNPGPGRRRSFVATRQDQPVGTDSAKLLAKMEESLEKSRAQTLGDDDDLPVLTEIVPAEEEREATAPTPLKPSAPPAPPMSVDIDELATRMAQAIDQQMAYELPTLVEATLLNIVADLRSGIASTMDTALREFIAREKQERSGDGE